jgi:hypothetical protein
LGERSLVGAHKLILQLAVFIKLKAITSEARDTVRQNGEIWLVMQRANHVQFSATRGPWLLVQAHGDKRWVHETHDSDFDVEVYSHGSDEDPEELRRRITGDAFEAPTGHGRRNRFQGRTLWVGGLVIGALLVTGLTARDLEETLGPVALLATMALLVGVYKFGGWYERQRVLQDSEEAVRRKVVSKLVERFHNRIASLYGREGHSKVIHLDAGLFIAMKDLVCDVYTAASTLDDDSAFLLKESVFHDSESICGVPLDPLRAWLWSWDSICNGSTERAASIKVVHLCAHGCLFLDDGRTVRRSDLRDTCCEFTESFGVTGQEGIQPSPSGRV